MPANDRPILVTGAHRSGTTWVGRVLAAAPSVVYIHEPFHVDHDPAVCAAHFDRWFTYVCEQNEEPYCTAMEEMLSRAGGRRPLIKDPIAVFSAAWLAARFQTTNVVMIRHPAAFAASLKVKGWTHPFTDFLQQPLLMAHHLEPFAGEILRFARQEQDIVNQAALLWKMIYSVILTYRQRFPDWIYVRHEDLARDPVAGFRTMFDRLDLEFGEAVERAIDAGRRIDPGGWRTELTRGEVARVKTGVEGLAGHFYADEDW